MDEARGPEDRIDRIVQEAEQGAQFEFNPAAWSAMEQKLDALDPVPFSIWKILFPVAGVILLMTVLLWPIGAQDRQQLETMEPARKSINQTEEPTQAAATDKVEAAEVETPTVESVTDVPQSSKSAKSINRKRENQASVQRGTTADVSNQQSLSQDGVRDLPESVASGVTTTATDRAEEAGIESPTFGGSEETLLGSGVDMLSLRWNPQAIILPLFNQPFEMDSSNFKDGKPKPYFEKSRWAFSAIISLDMSATGLDGFTDPGTMGGIGVEYYFAPGWSIQSGAAIAVKKYSALGSEYETPAWISARPDDFLEALANCLVIDIPLNVRKYFYTKKGRTFFASAGVSSYLMLREDYEYQYTEDRPNWRSDWSIKNQNQHYFGILNLSFGFEKPLGKNLALGIEPFMKLPLTGIGQGQVKFLSFGTNIAIKLRK